VRDIADRDPSWTGAAEVRGAPLRAVLAALWLAGRVAMNAAEWLPRPFVVIWTASCCHVGADAFFTIGRARQRLFWWTLLPLAAR
jgi:uncharacterized protein involved in response to NO